MLSAYFPFLTYAIPAIAGILLLIPAIELGLKYGIISYLVTASITFLIAETEAKLLFIGFFGLYPILKLVYEKLPFKLLVLVLKIVSFNLLIFLSYFVIISLLGMENVFGSDLNKPWFILAAYFIGINIVFIIYDLGVSQMIMRYHFTLSRIVRKTLRLDKR